MSSLCFPVKLQWRNSNKKTDFLLKKGCTPGRPFGFLSPITYIGSALEMDL